MPFPLCLKSGLLATGCALAGLATAAWLMPPASPAPASQAAAQPPARSPLGKPGGTQVPATVQGYLDSLLQAGTPARQMEAALRLASLTDPDEIRALLDQARSFPAHSAGILASQTLLKRWLELDPASALEYSRLHFGTNLPKLLGTYAATHPAEAEAWILSLPGGKAKAEAWQELCATIATHDPGKAWDLLARSPSQYGDSDASYDVRNLVQKLTAQDLEGTMARLSSMPAMLLKAARDAISKQLSETDPARGWEWARQQPNPNSLISNTIQATLKQDPAQALSWLGTLPAAQRKRILNEYGYNWGSQDSAALAAALSGNAGFSAQEKQELAGRLFSNASWQDPTCAEVFLPFLNPDNLPGNLSTYLNNRARKNGNADTEAWIAGLPPGPVRTAAEASWKEHQVPETPVDRNTPASLVRDYKKGGYLQENDARISQINAAQLGEMMTDQTGSKSYNAGRVLTSLAKTNPAPAAAWLASVPADAQTGPLGAQFSAIWAQEDPLAAAAWVNSLPAGDLAVNAAANVARQYHRYAPVEARTWLQTLPAGPVRDAAAKAMAGP